MAACISSQTPFLPRKLVSPKLLAVLQQHLFEPKVAVRLLVASDNINNAKTRNAEFG